MACTWRSQGSGPLGRWWKGPLGAREWRYGPLPCLHGRHVAGSRQAACYPERLVAVPAAAQPCPSTSLPSACNQPLRGPRPTRPHLHPGMAQPARPPEVGAIQKLLQLARCGRLLGCRHNVGPQLERGTVEPVGLPRRMRVGQLQQGRLRSRTSACGACKGTGWHAWEHNGHSPMPAACHGRCAAARLHPTQSPWPPAEGGKPAGAAESAGRL